MSDTPYPTPNDLGTLRYRCEQAEKNGASPTLVLPTKHVRSLVTRIAGQQQELVRLRRELEEAKAPA